LGVEPENYSVWRKEEKAHPFKDVPLKLPVASETIAAHDRTVGAGLEWDLAGLPARCAYRIVHLAGCIVTVAAIAGTAIGVTLTCNPAGFATLRFIRKAFLGEKLLFVGSKGEFLSAIFADDGLVVVHLIPHF
jgi:hypothetical protein